MAIKRPRTDFQKAEHCIKQLEKVSTIAIKAVQQCNYGAYTKAERDMQMYAILGQIYALRDGQDNNSPSVKYFNNSLLRSLETTKAHQDNIDLLAEINLLGILQPKNKRGSLLNRFGLEHNPKIEPRSIR